MVAICEFCIFVVAVCELCVFVVAICELCVFVVAICELCVHGLSGKFPKVQNSPSLRRPSGARQVLLSSNASRKPHCPILLSHCAVLLYVITCLARLAILSRHENECF